MADLKVFWGKIEISFVKKCIKGGESVNSTCQIWTGSTDRYGYGVKRVRWPHSYKSRVERAHRVAYMLHHKLLRDQIPSLGENGEQIDISHLCNNKLCCNPHHLILEAHSVNMSRNHCFQSGILSCDHFPACILPERL